MIIYFIATGMDPYLKVSCEKELYSKLSNYLQSSKNLNPLYSFGELGMNLMFSGECLTTHIESNIQQLCNIDKILWEEECNKIFEYLENITDWNADEKLIKLDSLSNLYDHLSFNYGVSGICVFLIELYKINNEKPILSYLEKVIQWIEDKHFKNVGINNSLYFGNSFYPLILAELSILTKNDMYNLMCKNYVKNLLNQVQYQSNLSHGIAGIGVMLLKCYKILNDSFYLHEAIRLSYLLDEKKIIKEDGVYWPVIDEFKGRRNEFYSLGFSHGIAGIGFFLTCLFDLTKNDYILENIYLIAKTLANNSIHIDNGGVIWPHTSNSTDEKWIFWCNGSTGIGWFLLKMHSCGILLPEHKVLLDGSLKAVVNSNIYGSSSLCHGLAGSLEFIQLGLNTVNDTTNLRLEEKSIELLQKLLILSIEEKGFKEWYSEDKETISLGYMSGNIGIYSTILRFFNKTYPYIFE